MQCSAMVSVIGLTVSCLVAGCGGPTSTPDTGSGGNLAGGTGSIGCVAPTCGGCQACFDRCYCQTNNLQGCVDACKTGSPTGAGGSGVGGSGNVGGSGATAGSNVGGSGTGGSSVGGSGTGGSSVGGSGTGGSSVGGSSTGGSNSGVGGSAGTSGSSGPTIELTMAPFTVQPGQEAFMCQNFKNPLGGADIVFNKTESFMTPGSHHLFVMDDPTVTSDSGLYACSGLTFKTLVHASQTPQQAMTYPPGIGVRMPGSDGFMLLAHYLNTTSQPLSTQVSVILYLADTANIQQYAASLFANVPFISIPPNSAGKAQGSCTASYNINLLYAVSHMHSHATHFLAKTSTGTTIYETTQWSEPQPTQFAPPLPVPAFTSIQYECDYQNNTSSTLTFGESAATNEMCILAGYYYPAPSGSPISCILGF